MLKRGETVGMELPLSDHVRGLDSSQGRLGRMKGLEAKHRPRNPLYEAMILFDDVVEVLHMQFPILGESSVALAKSMLGLRKVHGDEDYFRVHNALMADDGKMKANFDAYLVQSGFDVDQINDVAQSENVTVQLSEAQQLARALSISGTPAYVTRSRILGS